MSTTERKPTLDELIADAAKRADEQERRYLPKKPDERGPRERQLERF